MEIDFSKNADGLVPAIIQDAYTLEVLMLGYMSAESLAKTEETGLVTFFSRSRKMLWTKGETSGNYLHVVWMASDCDNDTILIRAIPDGPTCHKGTQTCWGDAVPTSTGFIRKLDRDRLLYEASDLVYHLLVLLESQGLGISDLEKELERRHR